MRPLTRRQALGACLFLPPALLADWRRAVDRGAVERPYLDAALRAEHWIRGHAIDTARGRTWPAVPGAAKGGGPDASLYTGAPGVVAFYLELHAHTGERRFLDEAVRGAREIAASVPERLDAAAEAGLYSGLAGHLAVLDLVRRASGRDDLAAAAARGPRPPRRGERPVRPGGPRRRGVERDHRHRLRLGGGRPHAARRAPPARRLRAGRRAARGGRAGRARAAGGRRAAAVDDDPGVRARDA
jgi:hypothetical protein